MSEIISSIKDSRVILARDLQTSAGRKNHKKFLLYGLEQIEWAMQAGLSILHVFGEKDLSHCSIPVLKVSAGILKKISGTNYLVPYVGIASVPEAAFNKRDFIVVLDDIQDYGNLGTIIRTAHGLFVDTFMFTNDDADPFQRKVIDSSRGSVFQGSFIFENNAQESIQFLKKAGYQIVVTSPHAKNLQSQTPLRIGSPIALVVGNETRGVDQQFLEQADIAIQIPMSKTVESLNVGVAAGISIYELKFRQVLLMLKEKIFANFGREISVLGKYIQMAFDAKISSVTQLSGKHIILLMIMHCDRTMTEKQISSDVGMYDAELGAFLVPLLERKLIVFENGEYALTSMGESFLAEIWPVVEQTQQALLGQLSDQELTIFMQAVGKIKDSCIAIIDEAKK